MNSKSPPRRRRRESLDSGFFMDDLPEVLLVEILCRIPCNKLIIRCKCVSKCWSDLISSTYFISRYLRIQRDLQKPRHLTTLLSYQYLGNRWSDRKLYTTSDHSVFQSASFSLGFLPYDQPQALEGEVAKSCYSCRCLNYQVEGVRPPYIVATYKDLVLCCTTDYHHRDYYLCNPYTKQWTRLPPARHVRHHKLPVALVCDPYYKYCEGEEQFFINPQYMWKVVRVVPNTSDPHFHLEIFSSETHQWREFDVSCSIPFESFDSWAVSSSSIAYNGMLYWCCDDGSIFELDLSSCSSGNHNNVAKCRFIELPEDLDFKPKNVRPYLVVSKGRLLLYTYLRGYYDVIDALKACELKQVVKEDNSGQRKFKWLVDRISPLNSKGLEVTRTRYSDGSYGRQNFEVEAFHPNNEDILYLRTLEYRGRWITCNLIGGRLEAATQTEFRWSHGSLTYPFVLLWWPTPIAAASRQP